MLWKTSYRFTESNGPINRPLFKSKINSTSIDEGTTIVIISGMNFVIFRAVPSIFSEIRYGGWYRNVICTVRFRMVFRYIEGTTLKIDLFQFLCMASRTTIGHVNIGIITLRQEYCKLIGLYWKLMSRQLRTLTCPIQDRVWKNKHEHLKKYVREYNIVSLVKSNPKIE